MRIIVAIILNQSCFCSPHGEYYVKVAGEQTSESHTTQYYRENEIIIFFIVADFCSHLIIREERASNFDY